MPAAESELARDPPAAGVVSADTPVAVVEAAAVPVDEPAARLGDELAERRHSVLERHRLTLLVEASGNERQGT